MVYSAYGRPLGVFARSKGHVRPKRHVPAWRSGSCNDEPQRMAYLFPLTALGNVLAEYAEITRLGAGRRQRLRGRETSSQDFPDRCGAAGHTMPEAEIIKSRKLFRG